MKTTKDKRQAKGRKRSIVPTFLTKLYQILEVKSKKIINNYNFNFLE